MLNVSRYAIIYHPYYAIVPPSVLDPCNLNKTVRQEPYLFTAIITIAAKDLPDGDELFRITSSYMQELVLDMFAGHRCCIGAVEALLLLAEWEPHSSLSDSPLVGCGDEDNAAWLHIGMAIRLANLLRLDRRSSLEATRPQVESSSRDTLTWTGKLGSSNNEAQYLRCLACYLSDRQISIRLGRAFQHPEEQPNTMLLSSIPRSPRSGGLIEENHSPVLQARIELTQIFTSVHNTLYLGLEGTTKTTLIESYTESIQEFDKSINAWKRVWGTLTCESFLSIYMDLVVR